MDDDFLIKQLKDNWNRYLSQKDVADEQSKFEMLYNCFENVGGIYSKKEGSEINKWLINNDNLFSNKFDDLVDKKYRHDFYINTHKEFRSYSPIINNTTGYSVRLDRVSNHPSRDFIDAVSVIRNNVRHGRKEIDDRSKNILRTVNILLGMTIEMVMSYGGYLEDKPKDVNIKQGLSVLLIFVYLLPVLIILWFLFGGLIQGDDKTDRIYVDCKNNPNSKYCNGSYDLDLRDQNGAENRFYQDVIR